MNIATDAAARKPFFSFTILPAFIDQDNYFTKLRPGGITAAEAVRRLAARVLPKDNCTVKRLQTKETLSGMAKEFGWTVKTVRYFLEKCQKMSIFGYEVGTKRGTARGTSHAVITYVYQQLLEEHWASQGTAQGTQGAHKGRSKNNTRILNQEDSLRTSSSESVGPRGLRMPPVEPDGGDNGADPSPASLGRESESTPHTESGGGTTSGRVEPKPSTKRKPPAGYCDEFERFWKACPARRGSKFKAYQSWWKLPEAERQLALEGAKVWKRNSSGRDAKYVAHVTTWLNGKRWETEAEAEEEDNWKYVVG